MRKKLKVLLKTLIISLVCCIVYVTGGYFYLNSKLEPVKQTTPSVPYYSEEPENAGVMVDIGGNKTYFFMDFYYKNLNVIFNAESFVEEDIILGYPIDHYITADFEVLAEIIDFVGGIELDNEVETLRYTGVQIVDMLTASTDYQKLERSIIRKIIEKIGENGFSKEDFLYIIENSDTTLTVPICYYWTDYIKELCSSVNEVN